MPKKGEVARQNVAQTIIKAFQATNDFVCFQDKKIYVLAQDGDNGEKLQFAISLTMPKTPVAAQTTANPNENGVSTGAVVNTAPTPVDISPEDREKVAELKKMLGITS